jgi:hypothetical protein
MVSILYSKDILANAVKHSDSLADVIRFLNKPITGSRFNYISRLVKQYELDTSHFTYAKAHGKTELQKRKPPEEILILIADPLAARVESSMLTRAMMESGLEYKCASCSLTDWQGKPLVLDVDHIDGNRFDCRLPNLRFLCPNCHRQTPTFGKPKTADPLALICGCGKPKARKSKKCATCHAHRKQLG